MIRVTRLNGETFYLNPDHIETMEAAPHTVVRLGNETKLLLKESIDKVSAAIIEFKRKIYLEQRER